MWTYLHNLGVPKVRHRVRLGRAQNRYTLANVRAVAHELQDERHFRSRSANRFWTFNLDFFVMKEISLENLGRTLLRVRARDRLPKTGHRIRLGRTQQCNAGSTARLDSATFIAGRQLGRHAADRLYTKHLIAIQYICSTEEWETHARNCRNVNLSGTG